jgi:hypothetical protein
LSSNCNLTRWYPNCRGPRVAINIEHQRYQVEEEEEGDEDGEIGIPGAMVLFAALGSGKLLWKSLNVGESILSRVESK